MKIFFVLYLAAAFATLVTSAPPLARSVARSWRRFMSPGVCSCCGEPMPCAPHPWLRWSAYVSVSFLIWLLNAALWLAVLAYVMILKPEWAMAAYENGDEEEKS